MHIEKIIRQSFCQWFKSFLIKFKVGFGYHLLGIMPQYQHTCPPDSVSINSTFLLVFSSSGILEQETMGSSLEFMNRDGILRSPISGPIEYLLNRLSASFSFTILTVMLLWNSERFLALKTSDIFTRPIFSQYFIWGCFLTVSSIYLLTKNFWQTGPISETTLLTLKGAAKPTKPLTLGLLLLSRYLAKQLAPKLVPTMQIGARGYLFSMSVSASYSSWKSSAVNGMGLVIQLQIPRLFMHTLRNPFFLASSTNTLIQFISLPPVSPCITKKMGALSSGWYSSYYLLRSRRLEAQSRQTCPPSSKNNRSRSQVSDLRGSEMLYSTWKNGCDRYSVGRQ